MMAFFGKTAKLDERVPAHLAHFFILQAGLSTYLNAARSCAAVSSPGASRLKLGVAAFAAPLTGQFARRLLPISDRRLI